MSSRVGADDTHNTPPECIRREIDAWPPSGLANDDQIDNLARSIWLALLRQGAVRTEDWIASDGSQQYPMCLVLPLGSERADA